MDIPALLGYMDLSTAPIDTHLSEDRMAGVVATIHPRTSLSVNVTPDSGSWPVKRDGEAVYRPRTRPSGLDPRHEGIEKAAQSRLQGVGRREVDRVGQPRHVGAAREVHGDAAAHVVGATAPEIGRTEVTQTWEVPASSNAR